MLVNTFIGMGANPQGPDLPTGLSMLLAQDSRAMDYFGHLSERQQAAVIAYVQGGATGDEAMSRMHRAVEQLRQGRWDLR